MALHARLADLRGAPAPALTLVQLQVVRVSAAPAEEAAGSCPADAAQAPQPAWVDSLSYKVAYGAFGVALGIVLLLLPKLTLVVPVVGAVLLGVGLNVLRPGGVPEFRVLWGSPDSEHHAQ